jgi:hypothetical protein
LLGGLLIRIIAAAVSLVGVQASVESVLIGGILLAMLLVDYAVNPSGGTGIRRWLAGFAPTHSKDGGKA